MTAAPEADRLTLIRRLTLDLTGLPPSLEQVDAFVADRSPDAYERLVDRLLASPAYGERWGRMWLDLVRYADSAGFEEDTKRPSAWRYRDWVVDALNADMPFDQFVRLQLAADELVPDQPRQRAALGFLRLGPQVGNQRNDKIRMDELDDVVSTTSSVFLGLTVGCARCHDHKFDPIPTEDYYRLVAVFEPGRFAEVPLATRQEIERHRRANEGVDAALRPLQEEVRAIECSARERLEAEKRAALPGAWRRAMEAGTVGNLTKDEQTELGRRLKIDAEELDASLSSLERSVREEWKARIAVIEATRPAPLPEGLAVVESLGRPGPGHVLVRGNVDQKGQTVWPGPPRAVAGELIEFPEAGPRASTSFRRSALAHWITAPANPLTARVQVNRIWQGHFGLGLVPTPSDFGTMGDAPELPELLDWLAAEFVASGWSQKAIHRLIVTSATYRHSSRRDPAVEAVDPDNTLWWRFPLRRLDAETIRDSMLWCAGTLNPKRSGPGVFPPIDPSIVRTGNIPRWPLDAREGPEVWRRSLYIFRMRSVPEPMLELFDSPDTTQSCPQRNRTTTPTQSLSLLNNPFVLEQAGRFAARVAQEAGPSAEARVNLAFRLATGRPPSRVQKGQALDFLKKQAELIGQKRDGSSPDESALTDVCHVLFNSNAFLHVD